MASSIESIIKSEQFQCRRVPNPNIPTVIVTNNETTNATSSSSSTNGGNELTNAANAQVASKSTKSNLSKYGRVVISLENPILPDETIANAPSLVDGLDRQTENDLRITGCKLIQISGVLLRLPQVAMATGQVLFQRYYYSKSFVRFPMEYTAMACVVLASKVEEAPRRIRDIINVFQNMKQIRLGQPPIPMLLNEAYVNMKNQVIKSERRILKELGFCVHVKHPHKYIITVAEILGNSKNTQLIQASWSYMNDSLHTNVFVRFSPETIACACIHLSARILRVPLPTSPPWYLVFGVDTDTIKEVCTTILQLYTRELVPQEELEEKVELAKKIVEDAKLKAKAQLLAQCSTMETSNANSMDSILVDSKTSSPIKYADGTTGSKNLEILSVINRLKQQKQNEKLKSQTSPVVCSTGKLRSTINEIERNDANSSANSTSSTPIKLEKSPHTLVVPPPPSLPPGKRTRSPSRDSRQSRSDEGLQSASSDDESRRDKYRRRHKNGHSEDDYNDNRAYRERDYDGSRRSRSPPRSYVSSTVTMSSNSSSSIINNDDRHKHRRRSPPSPLYDSSRRRYDSSYRDRDADRDVVRYNDRQSSSNSRVHDKSRNYRYEYNNNNSSSSSSSSSNRDRRDHHYQHRNEDDDHRRRRY